jgi:hypothetical protein
VSVAALRMLRTSRCCCLAKIVLLNYVMVTTSTPRSWVPYQDALHRDIGWSWVSRVSRVSWVSWVSRVSEEGEEGEEGEP